MGSIQGKIVPRPRFLFFDADQVRTFPAGS
jgi:hypothetical protein